ncbi:hypothetical protein [Haloarcula marismortui]|jgi:hypothetical protein|uniref:PASTA domain-containing protein n=1 Tax=Haloarcula marismortui ATCC 33799 TaxID=662475 RepID=M0K3M4_9EURY|nr:hypothetical protein [Haloarcula californiae]EMA15398.1 hypothetical protein C435_14763 [Haloarcula californiae ATCC 33799]
MSKKWTRRSALALIGSGAGLLTWGTGGFTDVTADRQVNINTTADDNGDPTDNPLLGITTHDGQVVFETETRKLVTLTNNIGPKLDTVKANVQNKAQLDFDVEIDSVPNSLDDESGTVTATVTGSGSNCIKETGQIELKISALSTSTDSAPEITATRSISLSCVNCLNFEQPETVTPSGFIPDTGSQFGLRDEFDPKSTLSYGWESEQTDTTRERGELQATEEDTLAHFTTNIPTAYDASEDPYWEIDLPNGWYDVTMHCRDPSYSDQEYSFDVVGGAETVKLRDRAFDYGSKERPTKAETYSFPVEVNNNEELQITPPDGTFNPKISWLRFESREDEPKPTVNLSAKGASNKRGISQNQDYYFKITNNHDAPIDLTAVRVDFARTVYAGEYIEPDLFGRIYGDNYEIEISVGEDLSFNDGTSVNADYRDALRNQWYDDIGEKAALKATRRGGQLAANEEAELGLFGFRRQTEWDTDLLDMKGADVHITLWYKKEGNNTEYSTTSAVFSSET